MLSVVAGTAMLIPIVQCAQPADPVLDCSASDVRHILRIHPSERTVEDLSFTPAKNGEAELSGGVYVLRFLENRDRYELIFQINAATGIGTRQLFDDEQQAIKGHGGSDEVSCKPFTGET